MDGDQRRIIAKGCSSELIAAVIGRVASPQHHHTQGLGKSPGPFLLAFPPGGEGMCCG